MADIYKMDSDYLSAESVYDRTLGKTQSEINNSTVFTTLRLDGLQNANRDSVLAALNGYNSQIPYGKIVLVLLHTSSDRYGAIIVCKTTHSYGYAMSLGYYSDYGEPFKRFSLANGTWSLTTERLS